MVQNGSMHEEKWKYEIKNYRFSPEKCNHIPPQSFAADWPEYYRKPGNVLQGHGSLCIVITI